MAVMDVLALTPARTLDDLSVKFAAILTSLQFNRSIVDATELRYLRGFRRDLARLRGEGAASSG